MISLTAGSIEVSVRGPLTVAMPRIVIVGIPVPATRPRGNSPWTDERVANWRNVIRAALSSAPPVAPIMSPVFAIGTWRMPRPPAHFSNKALKPTAPQLPSAGSKNDIDNLEKPVYDALQDEGILARGDGQVIGHAWIKVYAPAFRGDAPPDQMPGITLELYALPDLSIDGATIKHPKPTRRIERLVAPDAIL